ncbi:hypothetical protein EYF80_063633 [Liparis tanakae]|uniref:Uncharacterized protein n=1 Tax=Liparis tanakae TaxID=230148 RepID=A0A4Z2ECD4_9TELE|nr:hypothetical protein EYF80_063633 [Liparis tanakae]
MQTASAPSTGSSHNPPKLQAPNPPSCSPRTRRTMEVSSGTENGSSV